MGGYPFAGMALKGLEPYAGKLARTVLRGRKLPGACIRHISTSEIDLNANYLFLQSLLNTVANDKILALF